MLGSFKLFCHELLVVLGSSLCCLKILLKFLDPFFVLSKVQLVTERSLLGVFFIFNGRWVFFSLVYCTVICKDVSFIFQETGLSISGNWTLISGNRTLVLETGLLFQEKSPFSTVEYD